MARLESLQLELGFQHCPLQYNFKKWGKLATHLLIKGIWEKVSSLGIKVEINYKSFPLPKERDKYIMEEMINCLNTAEAVCFNRVRKHQETLTFSDICTPNGNSIDPLYLQD